MQLGNKSSFSHLDIFISYWDSIFYLSALYSLYLTFFVEESVKRLGGAHHKQGKQRENKVEHVQLLMFFFLVISYMYSLQMCRK